MELRVGRYRNSKGNIITIDKIDNKHTVYLHFSKHGGRYTSPYDILLNQMEFFEYEPIECDWD